jgi:hypothetical protein
MASGRTGRSVSGRRGVERDRIEPRRAGEEPTISAASHVWRGCTDSWEVQEAMARFANEAVAEAIGAITTRIEALRELDGALFGTGAPVVRKADVLACVRGDE